MNVATLSCVVVWCDVLCCCGVMYVVWGTNVVVVLWYVCCGVDLYVVYFYVLYCEGGGGGELNFFLSLGELHAAKLGRSGACSTRNIS